MDPMSKKTGTILAIAAAALFLVTAKNAVANDVSPNAKPVRCMGINSCKGQSECNTATHSCKGENSCKGKGWITVASEKVCLDKGGTVMK